MRVVSFVLSDAIPAFQQVEDLTKCPKEYVLVGVVSLLSLVVVLGLGSEGICTLVGFLYPTYASFAALEQRGVGSSSDSEATQWLIYWIVFATFQLMENFTALLLYMVPFYFAFKLAFLLWLILPFTRGSNFIYTHFLRDLLKKNENRVDDAFDKATKGLKECAEEAEAAVKKVATAAAEAAGQKGY